MRFSVKRQGCKEHESTVVADDDMFAIHYTRCSELKGVQTLEYPITRIHVDNLEHTEIGDWPKLTTSVWCGVSSLTDTHLKTTGKPPLPVVHMK